jgi:Tfp pilus assembly protein PilF
VHSFDRPYTVALVLYYSTLAVFFAASFFTEFRFWGVSHWGYYPVWVRFGLLAVGALVPVLMRLPRLKDERKHRSPSESGEGHAYLVTAILLVALFAAAFVLLRGRTHFLGDGYALLANLASEDPFLKVRNLGEMLVRLAVFSVLGGDNSTKALLSYQLASWAGGVLFLCFTFRLAAALFQGYRDRLLFSLGLASGGYMLLFFGYVENYSLFVSAVTVFAVVGLLAARDKCRSWLILVPLALALIFHVFGVTLIPAAVYLLVWKSKLGERAARQRASVKALTAFAVVTAAAAVFYHYYMHSYFFRFSIVPLTNDRFTVAGYTLFSGKHLLDYANLLLVLFPALPLVAISLCPVPLRHLPQRTDWVFLTVLLISTLGAAFVFDPRMGMPRDWDLFSFAGGPLTVFGFYLILDYRSTSRTAVRVAVLSVALGFLSLVPRVVGQVVPEAALAQVDDYVQLDTRKNGFTYKIIQDYYRDAGDLAGFARQGELWENQVPEYQVAGKGIKLKNQGRCPEAMAYFRRAIESNPMFAAVYYDLGSCFLALRDYDSAVVYLRIAEGLNPVHAQTRTELGYAYVALGKYAEAERLWKELVADGRKNRQAFLNLLELYRVTAQDNKFRELIDEVVAWGDAPAIVLKMRGDFYFEQGWRDQAVADYRAALQRGLDSAEVSDILKKFPNIGGR